MKTRNVDRISNVQPPPPRIAPKGPQHDPSEDPPIGEIAMEEMFCLRGSTCCCCHRKEAKYVFVVWTNQTTKHKFPFCEEAGVCKSDARKKAEDTLPSHHIKSY
jgi:hypothetical protein